MGGIRIEPEKVKKGLKYLSARTIAEKLKAAEDDMPYQFAEDVADDTLEYCDVCGIELPIEAVKNTASESPISVNEAASIMSFGVMKLISAYQKIYQGHELNTEDIALCLHMILTGVKFMAEALDGTLDEVMELNIDKLRKRYPDGFEAERSVNRGEEDVAN